MTVLDRREAAGIDWGQLGRIFASAALVGAIAAGAVLLANDRPAPEVLAPATVSEVGVDPWIARYTEQYFAKANALNKADIGRNYAPANRADLLFKQGAGDVPGKGE